MTFTEAVYRFRLTLIRMVAQGDMIVLNARIAASDDQVIHMAAGDVFVESELTGKVTLQRITPAPIAVSYVGDFAEDPAE